MKEDTIWKAACLFIIYWIFLTTIVTCSKTDRIGDSLARIEQKMDAQ